MSGTRHKTYNTRHKLPHGIFLDDTIIVSCVIYQAHGTIILGCVVCHFSLQHKKGEQQNIGVKTNCAVCPPSGTVFLSCRVTR